MSKPTPVDELCQDDDNVRLVSLKTVATIVDADRSTIRRWLRDAEIQPVVVGRGRNGAIRYRWRDVQQWLESLQTLD